MAKTATLNLRIDPKLKEILRELADREHRTISNLIETMVLERVEKGSPSGAVKMTKSPMEKE